MRQLLAKLITLAMFIALPGLMCAQEVASVTGLVTDETGAVVPDASVTLTKVATNTTYQSKTNGAGVYTITKVLPGPGYKLTFKRDGFQSVVINDIYIGVGVTRTQNAKMAVGKVSEHVEVSATGEGVSLNTNDASVGNNFNLNAVSQLPVQIRDNPARLLELQPGVVNAIGGSDQTSSREGSVTGARGDQNNVTLDGLDVNDFSTGQAFTTVGDAPVDSLQEFRAETAGSMAASGRGSGGQIQMVTKGGSNQWHGSVGEYHRNTLTSANSWFNDNAGIKKPALIRNQFGATLGGPILKDKLFFFFTYNGRRDAYSAASNTVVPLDSFRAGNISYIKAGPGCDSSSTAVTAPNCIGTLTPAQVAALDPQGIGVNTALLNFINSRYPHANDLTGGDGVNTGGYRFTTPVHRSGNDYVTRIDYNMNSKMKLFGRFTIQRSHYGDTANYDTPVQFPGDPLTHTIENTSYAYVIGHTWTISNTKVNQFTYGETVARLNFPLSYNPTGTTRWGFGDPSLETTYALLTNPYQKPSSQKRTIPIPVIRDDFSWQHGNHNIQFGGTFKPIRTENSLLGDYNSVKLGLGGNLTSLAVEDPSLRQFRPADLLQDKNDIANGYWDNAFALALGHIASIDSNYNYNSSLTALAQGTGSTRKYRYYEFENYLQDTWKVNSSLTLTYGLRYQYYSVPFEVNGIQATQNLGFNEYLFGRVQNGLAGIYGNNALALAQYDLAGKANNARGLYEPNLLDFAPRFSFAYSPSANSGWLGQLLGDRKTSIRGGFGVIYDHPVANALNFIQDQNSYMFQASTTTRYASDPAGALTNDPRFTSINAIPTPTPAPSIDRPYTPFTRAGVGTGLADSQFNYAVDPKLKTPYSLMFNLGFQRELPKHFVLETTYVGRLGRRLLAQADAAQVVDFQDPVSKQWMSDAFAALETELRAGKTWRTATPQPFFNNLISAYTVPGTTTTLTGAQVIPALMKAMAIKGDVADIIQQVAAVPNVGPNGLWRGANIGMPAQFAGNTYITNLGSSNYHGLLTSLHKNMSHGLQFDLNYTLSHSIDNASAVANSIASSDGMGFICDARNPRICRGNSDFDITHIVNGSFIYDLPFGKGKSFGSDASGWLNHVIGGWNISGIPTWRSGIAFSAVTGAYLMGYANNSPALFNGDNSAIRVDVHKQADGTVTLFADPAKAQKALSSPTGFTIGSRNNLRGPGYFNLDMAVGKRFPVTEAIGLTFRAEAYNSLNHPSFGLPSAGGTDKDANITSATFGKITSTSSTARVMQFSLKLEF